MTDKTHKTHETHALVVVDKSGSMGELADDVRGGLNSYVEGCLNDTEAEYTITIVLFDTEVTVLATAAAPADVPKLTRSNYLPMGSTALNDAVMAALTEFEAQHPQLGDDERAILIVNTDGAENRSVEFSRSNGGTEKVRARLAKLQEDPKWSVMFMGTGPDAWSAGHSYGAETISLASSGVGTRSGYAAASAATQIRSRGATADETLRTANITAAAEQQQP